MKHPFDDWFKKKKFTLVRGKDYYCRPYSMSVQLRTAAIARGFRVKVLIEDHILRVTVRRDDAEDAHS